MRKSLVIVAIAAFLILRTLLINVNYAEWGDSYRILRASNFVQHFSYPTSEKRPPLFSILLAVRPTNVDAVLWGRIVMFGISILALYVFYTWSKKYLTTQNQRLAALVLLAINPVYLYWSLRIYADVPFGLLVMLCFYVFELWREKPNDPSKSSTLYLALMGFICGLGILTRFEGYLLALSIFIGIVSVTKKYWLKSSAAFLLPAAVVILPWLLYRNPLTSTYFEEPTGRNYDLEMLLTYLVSYVFVLGIIPAASLIFAYFPAIPSISNLTNVVKKHPHIVAFVLLESLLVLVWPAAVPRLFVPIIPFLVIAFVKGVDKFFNNGSLPKSLLIKHVGVVGGTSMLLTGIYIVTQNYLRLQFLGSHTAAFILTAIVSAVCTLSIVLKQRKISAVSAAVSMLILSTSTIYLHKDIYRSIKEIADFSLRETRGKYIHNDTASIVKWYLPESEYRNFDDKKYLTKEYLVENQVDYIVLTNEFDPNLEIDLKKRPYLELIKESKYSTGGKMFFTWLIKVQK